MNMMPAALSAQPFFLDAKPGQRFCLYHAPSEASAYRGALIHVHPFAEEMNRARRMSALQSRAFAASGYAVLQLDLYGCGDSAGDFSDARWEIWKEDLAAAHAWLRSRTAAPIGLWGLRLGASLALDFAADCPDLISHLLLWQPVLRGETYLTQFLRLRLAADMLDGQGEHLSDTRALRAALAAGETLEVAGYEIAPALAGAIDAWDAAKMTVPTIPLHWMELAAAPQRPLPPAAQKLANKWQASGADLHLHQVQCSPFWLTQEFAASPELIAATSAIVESMLP